MVKHSDIIAIVTVRIPSLVTTRRNTFTPVIPRNITAGGTVARTMALSDMTARIVTFRYTAATNPEISDDEVAQTEPNKSLDSHRRLTRTE
jgi:hypothetical protein